jgi:hypothetical protein
MADRFLDFIDMIDGGGAGTMGDKFEGGGIFSMLANALATPYGSEDEERKRRLRQMRGLLAPDESISPSAAPRPTGTRGGGTGRTQVRPQARPAQSMPFGSTPVGGGMPAAPSMTFGNIPVGGGMPAARAAAPSVQSDMALPDQKNIFNGVTTQFGMPIMQDETMRDPFGYRLPFSDANQASDMVAPTIMTLRTERGINSPEGTEALRARAALRSRFPFATEQEIDQAMKMLGM